MSIRDRLQEKVKNKWKDSKIRKRIQQLIMFIQSNLRTIIIVNVIVVIILAILHLSFFILGLFQSYGKTPHYYCNVEASESVKATRNYQQYCNTSGSISANNKGIAEAAVSLATVDTTLGSKKIEWVSNGLVDLEQHRSTHPVDNFITYMPKIVEQADTLQKQGIRKGVSTWPLNSYYASCDLSISSAILWSGADDNFPMYLGGYETTTTSTYGQTGYLLNKGHNGKWMQVPRGDKVLPGDIALGNLDGRRIQHTWMYVGTWENGSWIENEIVQARFPGSTANRYEGSNRDYYSMLSRDGNPWQSSEYIFRYVGQIDELSSFRSIGGS